MDGPGQITFGPFGTISGVNKYTLDGLGQFRTATDSVTVWYI